MPENMKISWIALGGPTKKGYAITEPISICDSAATALWLLGLHDPAEWHGHALTNAFAR